MIRGRQSAGHLQEGRYEGGLAARDSPRVVSKCGDDMGFAADRGDSLVSFSNEVTRLFMVAHACRHMCRIISILMVLLMDSLPES